LEEDVRRLIGPLDRLVQAPVLDAHVVLTQEENPRIARPARAEAEIDVNGHIVRGRVAEGEMRQAVDQLAEHVGRQLRSFVERQSAVRRRPRRPPPGEWRHGQWSPPRPEYFPRPVEEREVVRRKSFSLEGVSSVEAAEMMQDLDHDFLLFRDSEADTDAVVYVRDDGRLGVIFPAGTPLPQNLGEAGTCEESRFSGPVALDVAVAEMDELGHRFMYFVNSETGRGNVIYLRYDGHYGLIEPASTSGRPYATNEGERRHAPS
jgi:ribosome-associated translation inhibitor RaiA